MKVLMLMALCVAGLKSFADSSSQTVGDYTWYYSGTAESGLVVYKVEPATGNIVMPSAFDGTPVVGVRAWAFSEAKEITGLTIPSSVKTIGEKAFYKCTGLCTLDLQAQVENFGAEAFSGCTSLKSVTFGPGIKTIGESAFVNCTSLTGVDIPEGVTNLSKAAFCGCSAIQTIKLPASLQKCGTSCFSWCSNVCDLQLPTSLLPLYNYFLESQGTLTNVVCVGDATALPDSSFGSYRKLEAASIPDSVRSIGKNAFVNCEALKSLRIPANLTKVGEKAFYNSGIESIELPKTTSSIGANAFAECEALMSVKFGGDAPATCGSGIYDSTPIRMVTYVPKGSVGWLSPVSTELPETWNGRAIVHYEQSVVIDDPSDPGVTRVCLTVTNVVLHYVLNSAVSTTATPIPDSRGFVAVITEVQGSGAVAIPESWADQFPSFKTCFGEDFGMAIVKPSGKLSATGDQMFVWQDYVAGTDPTDQSDVFTASITLTNGVPYISWTPNVPSSRVYEVWGKKKLVDDKWEIVGDQVDQYNFFKVTVGMKSQLDEWAAQNPDGAPDEEFYGPPK